ncbi:MAG: HAD family hydrolase [Oscillospiraceae bacterium]|nr:HAD family hydrolase [Oscillospiraceae bacterium]
MKTVLFDLDGTLLPMDQDEFANGYFRFLVRKMEPYGYEGRALIKTVWGGTAAMVKNDGSRTNEEAFWRFFADTYGEDSLKDRALFEEFYATDFICAKDFCGFTPRATEAVRRAKELGGRAVLATNPIFPDTATRSRIDWAGLDPEDFELYTTYENIGWCKPNPEYFREIMRRLDLRPEDCIMVGNDADEDMAAEKTGMKVFLLTDCLINKSGADIDKWPHGGFGELIAFIESELGA